MGVWRLVKDAAEALRGKIGHSRAGAAGRGRHGEGGKAPVRIFHMGKVTGFIEFKRDKQPYRPVAERLSDWRQVMLPWPADKLQKQGARCMDCGIPFCHQGCPLGNLIPDWNDLVYRDKWRDAIDRLHATNNFPEFTGTLCPAPCEGACVLGINDDPVTIKGIEISIIDRAFAEGWVTPEPPEVRTGKQVAVIGSGPAGLAAAQQLNRAGHWVTLFERDDRIGGLLRYGIPEFKMEKRVLDRRLAQMAAEGVQFKTGCHVGVNVAVDELRREFDALLLSGGACAPRDLSIPGRELAGIHFAMEYLTLQNRRCEGEAIPDERFITAHGKRVVIIGGGDTGADCLGTTHRQGAASIHQFEILPRPPDQRGPDNPWPEWPNIYRVSSAHEEGESASTPSRPSASSVTRAGASPRSRSSGSRRCATAAAPPSRKSPAPTSLSPVSWRCSPWAFSAPSGPACWPRWASSSRSAAMSGGTPTG